MSELLNGRMKPDKAEWLVELRDMGDRLMAMSYACPWCVDGGCAKCNAVYSLSDTLQSAADLLEEAAKFEGSPLPLFLPEEE